MKKEPPASMLELIARLAKAEQRMSAAKVLAERLGGDFIMIFIRDPEVGALLPAPGFPQTLPKGRRWHTFLQECVDAGECRAELPYPDGATTRWARGVAPDPECVLVLLQSHQQEVDLTEVTLLLPLIAAALQREQAARAAEGQSKMAREAAEKAKLVTESLDNARRELQRALSEAEEERRRSAFLAEASTVLSASLDYEVTLQHVARLAVPFFADICIVDVIEEGESIRRIATEATTSVKSDALRELEQNDSVGSHLLRFHARASSEKAVLVPEITDSELKFAARDTGQLNLLRTIAPCSSMTVPLKTLDRTLGAMTFVMAESQRHYSARDLGLGREIARRVALAVDNARLYREAQDAIRERETFLSVASHELKTPITILQGFTELLLRRAERDAAFAPRERRTFKTIHEQSNRLSRLVELLLEISWIRDGRLELEREPVDLVTMCHQIAELWQPRAQHHRIEVQAPETPLWIKGDALRMEQVLQNLLDNAIKYSPGGGQITIHLKRHQGQVQVVVVDDGVGIPQEALPNLFDPFYRVNGNNNAFARGMGLGLAIANEIIMLHGGAIRVDSEVDAGTRFTILLPAYNMGDGSAESSPSVAV